MLWGWAGQPIDAALVEDIAAFADTLPGPLADELAVHITDAEIDALAARTKDLLERPVMPLPRSTRPIPWPAF
ncbi:hypothetical protein B7C42_08355 [Nocardia cerradoensis]|uniref:Uncharacterized protein n=1 Tax=Nocardia cerradoensis TaxID=85688 RepID=A0A231GSG8_9NOCA|nr:hypothetical protein B7C42_08355 [Nocardia cerradoensis]